MQIIKVFSEEKAMRAVFTVQIPPIATNRYPSNDEFLARIRALGFEDSKTMEKEANNNQEWYKLQAEKIWDSMPETTINEKDYVIFYGELQDSKTIFVITRLTEEQATFRLINPNLSKLKMSAKNIVKAVTGTSDDFDLSNTNDFGEFTVKEEIVLSKSFKDKNLEIEKSERVYVLEPFSIMKLVHFLDKPKTYSDNIKQKFLKVFANKKDKTNWKDS